MQGGGSGAHAVVQQRLHSAIRHIAEAQRLISEFLNHCASGPRPTADLAYSAGTDGMDDLDPLDEISDESRL